MMYRVVKPFSYQGPLGQDLKAETGTLVDIQLRTVAEELLRTGMILPRELHSQQRKSAESCSPKWSRSMRVGIWLRTSSHYSGGRIHMFQYAWCLAEAGAEVYLVTNTVPKWIRDYPALNRIHLVIGEDLPPSDIDVIVTDSKESLGRKALEWKNRHPWCPLVCMNFETPNWVEEFAKEKAHRLGGDRKVFEKADLLLANSSESMRYLSEWMDTKDKITAVIRPAVNVYAIEAASKGTTPKEMARIGDRPYAVWCARAEKYKGCEVAFDAVFKADSPLDLVLFGSYQRGLPQDTDLHRVYKCNGLPDQVKFYAMKNAQMVLAPSLFEGFGMIPAEATACGTPVIAFDLPVIKKEYKGLDGIHLVKHGDKAAYAKKVNALAAKPKVTVDPAPVVERLGLEAMAQTIEHIPYHAVRRPRVTAQLVAYWGFSPESVESIYDMVDEIKIAYGRVEHAPEIDDGTLERLRALPDPDGKIELEVRDRWANKREMRSWCSDRSTGNRMLMLDGDEIWVGLGEWIKADVFFGSPRWVNLWHGADYWIHDANLGTSPRWGGPLDTYGSSCPHYRWSFWRRSYYWKRHHTPADRAGSALTDRSLERPNQVPACAIYHLGHALGAAVMQAKHDFYIARDGDDPGRQKRMAAWHDWDGKPGDCGDGIVDRVTWEVPEIVRRAVERISKEVLA